MLKVSWSALFFLFVFSAVGQNFYKQPLREVLTSTKSKTYIAVEGYYVDNSSFMVTRSSDAAVEVNMRYPVYEYKYQVNLHSKDSNNMVEVPVYARKEIQGIINSRILFLNKKRTSNGQLVIEESAIAGMPIVGDTARYLQSAELRIYTAALPALRDFLFDKGMMPPIGEGKSSLN